MKCGMLIRDEYAFKMAGLAVHVLIGITCTVFLMSMAATDYMCSSITRMGQQKYTFYYKPCMTEPMECCCDLLPIHPNMSVSISSNATYFQLVFLNNFRPDKVLRNETGISLSNKVKFCAPATSNSTEAGAVTIEGPKIFTVTCRANLSCVITTNVHVPPSATTEQSVQNRTPLVASEESTTSIAVVPPTEKPDDNTIIWIIILSVAGTLVVIIGFVVYCLVFRKQSRGTERDDCYEREGNDTLMADNILYSRGHTIYSLARGAEPMNNVVDSHDPRGDLVMSENCLYNHHEKQRLDGNVHEGQGHTHTAGKQDQPGEASTHREEPDFSYLYAKVDKTSSQSQ